MKKPWWARRFGPYTVVAAVVTAVDYAIFITLIKIVGVAPVIANVCSWAVAVVVAYGLHSAFTFDTNISLRNFARYVAVSLSTLILGTSFLVILTAFASPLTAKVVSTIFVFTVSFALSHLTVFRDSLT